MTHSTSSTTKHVLLFITLTAINVFFLTAVNALTITIDAPEEVDQGEDFDVTIDADTTETYDIKIFVHDSDDEKIARDEYISEIYDDGWKDPWFYLQESFPDAKEYGARVNDDAGDFTLCARLRKSSARDNGFEETCTDIEVKPSKKSTDNKKSPQSKEKDDDKEIKGESEQILQVPAQNTQQSLQNEPVLLQQKITLNSPQEAPKEQRIITTQQSARKKVYVYAGIVLGLIVIVLLALKRL